MVCAVVGSIRLFIEGLQSSLKCGALLLMLGALLSPAAAPASLQRPLRVCINDSPFPPFTDPAQEAPGQRLVRRAVEAQGLALEFFPSTWKRCLRGIQRGVYDGVVGTAATPEYRVFLAFPRVREEIDQRRALGTTTMKFYRRAGSRATWNGLGFENLDGPVLYLSGRSALGRMLEDAGVRALDYARSPEQLALMMLNGRGSLAIDHQSEVERISRMPEYQGRFEILPRPFVEAAIYFAVGLDIYRQQRALFEQIWSDIARYSAMQQPLEASKGSRHHASPTPQTSSEQDIAPLPLQSHQTGALASAPERHPQHALARHSTYPR